MPNRPSRVASVIVASIVWSPSSARKNTSRCVEHDVRGRLRGPSVVVVGQAVAAQLHNPNAMNARPATSVIGTRRQRRAEQSAHEDRHEVDEGRRHRDADSTGHGVEWVAKRQRHQLALVAELATKITPKLTRVAVSTLELLGRAPGARDRTAFDPVRLSTTSKVSPARRTPGPADRASSASVSIDQREGYSPSPARLPVEGVDALERR